MEGFVRVGTLEALREGTGLAVSVGSARIGLFRVGGGLYAIEDRCPHKGGALVGGALDGEIITCPSCRYQYSVVTGLNPRTTSCHVNQSTAACHYRNFPEGRCETYDVRVEGPEVFVATTPRPFRKPVG